MADALQRVIASYEAARRWMEQLREGYGRPKNGRVARNFNSLEELSLAVAEGQVGFGDLVSASGWLSLYASWYLPAAYSPYQLSVSMVALDVRWMVKTSPAPALLPAGQLPFAFKDQVVGFIYPTQTSGFAARLLPDDGGSRYGAKVQRTSADDNPWIMSIDNGIGTCHPMSWVFTLGDQSLDKYLQDEASAAVRTDVTARIKYISSYKEAPILNDPAFVRRAVTVPAESQPIPIVFPQNFERYIHEDVRFQARISPLDTEVLAELSRLGQPLTEKAFALFCGNAQTRPFCLRVEGEGSELKPLASQTASQRYSPGNSQPKIRPLLVEWYFEDPQTKQPVPFDDEALLTWFIPCAKNYVLTVSNDFGDYILPTRWTGKLYGFESPLYFFQIDSVGFTMSPDGFFTATQIAVLNSSSATEWEVWRQLVTIMQRDLIERYYALHGRRLIVRTTYLTDWGWMAHFGNVLEGRAIWKAAQESLSGEKQAVILLRALQNSQQEAQKEKKTMRPVKVLFVSSDPIDQKPLQLGRELRDIKERIKMAKNRDLLLVEPISAVRPQDLLQAFNEHEVDIFHFSGHGAESGELGLCSPDGLFHPLIPEALASLMRVLGQKVQVAVINACYSKTQAEAIRQYIPCAIGMNDKISDEAAITFSMAFYSALAFGKDVQNAYEQGILALQMENISEDHIPELLVKDGIDPSTIRPVQESEH